MRQAVQAEALLEESGDAGADVPPQTRINRLAKLTALISEEVRALGNRAVIESLLTRPIELSTNMDFYEEVVKFETRLIKLMLDRAGGNQARAARLMGLNASTLHGKIKRYGILK